MYLSLKTSLYIEETCCVLYAHMLFTTPLSIFYLWSKSNKHLSGVFLVIFFQLLIELALLMPINIRKKILARLIVTFQWTVSLCQNTCWSFFTKILALLNIWAFFKRNLYEYCPERTLNIFSNLGSSLPNDAGSKSS